MKQVIVLREFEGYPNGDDKAAVSFAVTGKPVDVPDDFADMIVGKGLARAVDGAAAGKKKPSATAPGDA